MAGVGAGHKETDAIGGSVKKTDSETVVFVSNKYVSLGNLVHCWSFGGINFISIAGRKIISMISASVTIPAVIRPI